MKRANIELHIEELVLHGFAPGDRYHIVEVVERELTKLLMEQYKPLLLTINREVVRLDGGTLKLAPGPTVESFGSQLAEALIGGLSR